MQAELNNLRDYIRKCYGWLFLIAVICFYFPNLEPWALAGIILSYLYIYHPNVLQAFYGHNKARRGLMSAMFIGFAVGIGTWGVHDGTISHARAIVVSCVMALCFAGEWKRASEQDKRTNK